MIFDERRPLPKDGRYCAYLRKSREEERAEQLGQEKDVLARHEAMLKITADMRGHEIEKAYREVLSGESIAERDAIKDLIVDVEAGKWDGIYVVAVDRLARGNKKDQGAICELLEAYETFVITTSCYYDCSNEQDLDAVANLLDDAHKEYKAAAKRMHAGAVLSVLQGQFIGSFVPYGFEKTVTEDGKRSLAPVEEEAKWVVKMFEWYDEGDTMWGIAKRLNDLGVDPPRRSKGAGWRKEGVTGILKNPCYAGWAVWGRHKSKKKFSTDVMKRKRVHYRDDNYIKAPALWDPIVSQELFNRVQERIKGNKPFSPSTNTVNPLAHLLFCSGCGRSMLYLTNSRDGKRRYQHQNWYANCGQKGTFASVVLDKLADVLQARVDDIEVSLEAGKQTRERAQAQEAADRLAKQLADLDKQETELARLRAKGEITAEVMRRAQAEVGDERAQAKERLAEANRTLEREEHAEALATTLHKAIEVIRDPEAPGAAKNKFLRDVIDRIEYSNDSEPGSDDKLRLEVYLK
ncbi:MAG: recombinase family protein [Coriobacteriales bacterium]